MANNKIQVKRTSTSGRTPNTTNSGNSQYIAAGELALNMVDGILYSSNGSALIEVGGNTTSQRITNSLTLDNDKRLFFQTVNTSVYAAFVQQSDDNFVFYTSNSSYGSRAVFSIYANSNSSEFSFQTPVRFNANITVLSANGTQGSPGQVLSSDGTNVYWATPGAASVNTAYQWVWSNTQTFQANVAFTGNNISVVSNTGSVMFGGASDTNWRIGRSTGSTTKFYYSNNTLDIIAAASNLEGVVIGQPGGNTYLETGYAGTFTRNPIYVGNASVNVTINSTSFSGTANNSSYLNGKTESNLNVNNALTANASTYLNGKTESNLNVNNALTANNSSYLGGIIDTSYLRSDANDIFSGTYLNPSSNTILLGNSTARWVISANTIDATGNFTSTANVTANNANTTYDLNVGRNLFVSGNLTIGSNVNIIGANNLSVVDNMIYLNANNTSANPDIGIAANYNDGTYRHTGIFRDASDGIWKVFDSYTPEPDANIYIDTTNTSFQIANFQANTLYLGNTSTNWLVANGSGVYHTGRVNAAAFTTTGNANAAVHYAGANVYMNATTMFVSTNSTMNTVISANQITLNGANVITTATVVKVYYANGVQAYP